MRKKLFLILSVIALMPIFGAGAFAQFKKEAFSQNYSTGNPDEKTKVDSANLFTFKNYFAGLAHKEEVKPGVLVIASGVFIGGDQIYNHQAWKLPIIYGGIGSGVALGLKYRHDGDYTKSKIAFLGAGLVYWGTMMDGVINYNRGGEHDPRKAFLYSMLVPGLGQVYNNEEWKVPLYWGCLLGSVHFYRKNKLQYDRFKRIYKEATSTEVQYTGPISAQTAKYYKDIYREYRDYSVLAIAGFYLLQIIDAHVFSIMKDFNVNDDVAMSIEPAVLSVGNDYCFNPANSGYGLSLGIRF